MAKEGPEVMIGDGPEGDRSNRMAKQARRNRALSKRTECLRKCMHTRSKGRDNLLSTSDLDKAEQNKRSRRVTSRTRRQEVPDMAAQPQQEGFPPGPEQQGGQRNNPPLRPHRQIGAGDAPNTHENRQGIAPPNVHNNFEIKPHILHQVQQKIYHGLPEEDPLDHLDEFDRACDLITQNGVSEDATKLRLFPFSLDGKARQWEKTIPRGSITSWDQCKKAFLAKFFSSVRTASFRTNISSFAQKHGESFTDAWERFKGYQSKQMLDTASQGNFLARDVDDGLFLVENMAMSNGTYGEDHDRTNRGSVEAEEKHKKELKVLNDKLDKLLIVQQKQSVHMLEERDDDQEEEFYTEDVNYIHSQGYYKNNPNMSYRSTNVENPQDQVYPPQANTSGQGKMYPTKPRDGSQEPGVKQMLQQLLQGQSTGNVDLNKRLSEINGRIDFSHHDLQTKIEALTSRIHQLEHKGGTASSSRTQGQLPGKAEQNPKEYVQAITLRSGRALPPRTGPAPVNEDIEEQEEEISVETEATAPVTEEEPPVQEKEKAPEEVQKKKKAPAFVPPPYKPQLPFPVRFKKQQLEKAEPV
ncbi:unnamed protein product [Microthlaspi erraticum]|uniref:Retrotransposon gag domain-containing protein n=1 Tax=Microthlaspi erraticum TaxID=1685480 RepID=A0A6D2KBL0_9BRAS|nr:unnamed protein product [Microthlaspi erraticum]